MLRNIPGFQTGYDIRNDKTIFIHFEVAPMILLIFHCPQKILKYLPFQLFDHYKKQKYLMKISQESTVYTILDFYVFII